MKTPGFRPPHVERLTQRVRALDGPLVQLWAWAGAGQQAVLDVLTEDARFGQPLSLDVLGDEVGLRRTVEAAFESGARWLVLPAVPSLPTASLESAGTIARLLAPGQRLVFSAPRKRPPGPLACSYLLPEEFLLDGDELAELWRGVTGAEPGQALVDRLLAATDGWYRPLRLVAEAAAEAGGSVDADALLQISSIASFLRHEVLALMEPEERELLAVLGASGRLGEDLWDGLLDDSQRRVHRRLLEEWGLALEEPRGLRLPTLLRTFLAREREARWPREHRLRLAARLGRAEWRAGHPVRALEHLVEAAEGEAGVEDGPPDGDLPAAADALTALVEDHWSRLFAAAPLQLLERATAPRLLAAPGAGDGAPAARFLAALAEGLLWRRETALASRTGSAPSAPAGAPAEPAGLAPAVALAAELLSPGAPADGEAERRDWASLPEPLRPLRVVAELREAAAEEEAGERPPAEGGEGSDVAATAALLVPALERVSPGRRPPSAGGDPLSTPLQALFERSLLDLLRRRPSLVGELGRRRDLPQGWRRWLAGLPPAALASETSGYAVRLLGKPALRLRRAGGRSVEVRFPLRRAFQVFAYLASAPGFEATRDELVEAVWHDEGDEAVDKNFHPTLSYVRRALEAGGEAEAPPLLLRRGVYRLNPRLPWTVDVVDLERRAEEGRRRLREGQPEQAVSLWQSAWGLYRGPFLAGWDAPWISTRRSQLADLHLQLLVSLGEACEGQGRVTEAMDAYRAALIEDPLQERTHLALMRIYARQGRRDLVRRQYERLTTLLSEELGVEPLEETTDAYHRLMA